MSRIDLRVLRRMLRFMEEAGLSELDIEMEGLKVRLRKGGGDPPPAAFPAGSLPPVSFGTVPPVAPPAPAPPGGPAAAPTAPDAGAVIRSPMVGTFYRASSPTAQPFVNAGDLVKEGQTLCLIEAMKLMNEIKAERAARIVKVLAENGVPVEFDQPLFEVESA